MKIKVSIIIVAYKANDILLNCLKSIKSSKINYPYEVIVIDNDNDITLKRIIERSYNNVNYLKAKQNNGFGAGNNLGASKAKGEYLFILNPDTVLDKNCIDILVSYMETRSDVGIISPLLHNNNNIYPLQGTRKLGYFEGIMSLSFINKYFPNNQISKRYLMRDWNKKNIQEVDVIPGAAFMIKKTLFEEVDGFDERFFLYFEEVDLCRRVIQRNYKLEIIPEAKVIHLGGKSTKQNSKSFHYFKESRKYYFTKYYGSFAANLLEIFLAITSAQQIRNTFSKFLSVR